MSTGINLIPKNDPTMQGSSSWRTASAQQQRCLKIGLAVTVPLAMLLVVAIVLVGYFSAANNLMWLSSITVVGGGFGAFLGFGTSIPVLIGVNMKPWANSLVFDTSDHALRVHLGHLAGDVDEVYKTYASKEELTPLVRHGLLTPAEGNRILQLFKEKSQIQAVVTDYSEKKIQKGFEGRDHAEALDHLKGLQRKWRDIQGNLTFLKLNQHVAGVAALLGASSELSKAKSTPLVQTHDDIVAKRQESVPILRETRPIDWGAAYKKKRT